MFPTNTGSMLINDDCQRLHNVKKVRFFNSQIEIDLSVLIDVGCTIR